MVQPASVGGDFPDAADALGAPFALGQHPNDFPARSRHQLGILPYIDALADGSHRTVAEHMIGDSGMESERFAIAECLIIGIWVAVFDHVEAVRAVDGAHADVLAAIGG